MKREDGRVIYTKMRIKTAFYDLLNEMNPDKITVTALCARAEINRATFYKHYLDVPDLIEKLQDESINEFAEKLNTFEDKSIEEFIVNILKVFKSDQFKNTIWNNIQFANSSEFTSKITNLIYMRFSNIFDPYTQKNPSINRDGLYAFISAGSAGLIDYWIKSGYKENEEEIAHKITYLCLCTLKSL